VFGGSPVWSEKEGQVLFAFAVGSAGQHPPEPKTATDPKAAASLDPAQLDAQETVW